MSNEIPWDETILIEVAIHDLSTGYNLTLVLKGTKAALHNQMCLTGRLLFEAGFRLGWQDGARDVGEVDLLIIAREATERCWKMREGQFNSGKPWPDRREARCGCWGEDTAPQPVELEPA